MWSASSARSAANVSITSSSSMSFTCAVCCRPIFNIITRVGRISRSTRIVQSLAPYSHPLQAPSSPSHKWAVYIIATNVAQRELLRVTEPPHLFRRGRCALQLGRSNMLAPPKIHAGCPTHSLWPTFSSTAEISSVVIFACQPFLRPKRIFEQRQALFRAAMTHTRHRPTIERRTTGISASHNQQSWINQARR
jgi:hypothetical protein